MTANQNQIPGMNLEHQADLIVGWIDGELATETAQGRRTLLQKAREEFLFGMAAFRHGQNDRAMPHFLAAKKIIAEVA